MNGGIFKAFAASAIMGAPSKQELAALEVQSWGLSKVHHGGLAMIHRRSADPRRGYQMGKRLTHADIEARVAAGEKRMRKAIKRALEATS